MYLFLLETGEILLLDKVTDSELAYVQDGYGELVDITGCTEPKQLIKSGKWLAVPRSIELEELDCDK